MPIVRRKWIARQQLRDKREWLWVFGDNVLESGLGGQAREMRGEPNAVGIPTKWAPARTATSYFTDADYERVYPMIARAFQTLNQHLMRGGTVVWPEDGVGTGLSELPERAPAIFAYIKGCEAAMQAVAEAMEDRT